MATNVVVASSFEVDEDACLFCASVNEITRPDHVPFHLSDRWPEYFVNMTCEQLQQTLPTTGFGRDSQQCFLAHETNYECGCDDGLEIFGDRFYSTATDIRVDRPCFGNVGVGRRLVHFRGLLAFLLFSKPTKTTRAFGAAQFLPRAHDSCGLL